MGYEIETSLGVFVIYNRQDDQIPEIELLGDDFNGTGYWHFGWKGGYQCRYGYQSAEAALDKMDEYAWANCCDQGWKP
jgi:hypothetical protein